MNTEERQASWQQVYDRILSYDTVEQSQAVAFLSLLQPQAMSDGFLMLTAETEFIRDWVERHYSDVIKQALTDIYQIPYTVIFEVNPNQTAQVQQAAPQAQETEASQTVQSDQPIQPVQPVQPTQTDQTEQVTEVVVVTETQPAVQAQAEETITFTPAQVNISEQNEKVSPLPQVEVEIKEVVVPTTPLPTTPVPTSQPAHAQAEAAQTKNEEVEQYEPVEAPVTKSFMPPSAYTFESFVVGSSNQMAYSMALAVAENPGQTMLNPLFIYGRPGLGKTHLMRAIQNFIIADQPELTATYVDSSDLLNQYVDATVAHDKEKSSFKNFKNNYQEADVLLIDDVQYLQGKTQTLDIIFQIFNFLIDQGKQIVLSADRAPKNIDMDERYQSRFNSGATFDIQPPEIETKLAIVKSFIDEYRSVSGGNSFDLPEDIMMYIAEISGPNIRELKSAITKVIYTQNTLNKEQITKEDVSEILQNHFTGGATKQLQITDIQKAVEQYYGLSHSDLIGQKRVREIAHARQVAIYLCREMLELPYKFIAQSFGGRDHSTIMHSVSQIEKKMKQNRDVAEEIENIKRRIKEA